MTGEDGEWELAIAATTASEWDSDSPLGVQDPSSLLDEDGFPAFERSSESSSSTSSSPMVFRAEPHQLEDNRSVEADNSFAFEFYRCGTDWSSLIVAPEFEKNIDGDHVINNYDSTIKGVNDSNKNGKKRALKQANLFQLWGLQNPPRPSTSKMSSNKAICLTKLMGTPKQMRINSTKDLPIPPYVNSAQPYSPVQQRQRTHGCPFYKKIPGTPFTVDAFRYGQIQGCSAYFLSHFHADHYGGLSKRWSYGPIYCTPLTARLVKMCLYVNPSFVHPLEFDTEHLIVGIKVTLLEANHCPGAALIHVRLPSGYCYLHTGDFRASRLMQTYPILLNHRVNVLYLDTTYCHPKYRFPPKEGVLDFVVNVTKTSLRNQPKTLVVVGAYSIGKESVYLSIAKALGIKIYANAPRRRILNSFGWPDISHRLSTRGNETPLHVLPVSSLKFEILERYLRAYNGQYTKVLAFRPTGWTYSEAVGDCLDLIKPSSRGNVTLYGVPYSEHSSFTELQEFVQFLRPDRIIPTVNIGNANTRVKMQSYIQEWLRV